MAYTAQDIINLSNAGRGQDIYDAVRNGRATEADVRATLGDDAVNAFLQRTQQQAPVPTMLGEPATASSAPLFNFTSSTSAPPQTGNIAIPGNQGLQSGNVAIPASQGTQSANNSYTQPPATTAAQTNTTPAAPAGTNQVLGRPGLPSSSTTPSAPTAPTVPTPTGGMQPPASGGNAGGYFNPSVPGGTTANNNYTQYPTPIPTSPNYELAAQQQGEANLNAAKGTVALSNPNQITPYGSQTYTLGPDGRPVQNQSLSPELQQRYNDLNSILPSVTQNIREQTGRNIGQYDFSDVMDPNSVALSDRKTATGVQGQSAVAEALRAREQPRLDKKRQQLETQLLTRGFNPGTEGWNEAIDDFSRAENDFNLGLVGISGQEQSRLFDLDSSLRSQEMGEFNSRFNNQTSNRGREINEQVLARQLPIQEYQQLVSAMQPQLPQFNGYTGATVEANPILGATAQQGLFDLGRYGTSVQGELGTRDIDASKKAANNEALADMAAAAAMMYASSDVRLKENIEYRGTTPAGHNLYTWTWKEGFESVTDGMPTFGVLAQEAARISPEAVVVGPDGYLRVNYGRIH